MLVAVQRRLDEWLTAGAQLDLEPQGVLLLQSSIQYLASVLSCPTTYARSPIHLNNTAGALNQPPAGLEPTANSRVTRRVCEGVSASRRFRDPLVFAPRAAGDSNRVCLLWLQDLSCNQLLPPPARHHPIRQSTRLCARKNGVLWLQVSYCAKDLEAARKVPMHVGMPTHHPVICALQGLLRQVQLGLLRHHPCWCSSATGCRSVQVYPLHNCSGERDADAGAMLAA